MATASRKIVRLMGKDLPGEVNIERALQRIKGIGFAMSRTIRIKSGLPANFQLHELNESQLAHLSKILESPEKLGIPKFMLNRRRDYSTGLDRHLLEADLIVNQREDIQRMKKIKTYKGVRHILGLRVRGQRTRSTGRGRVAIGVVKKKKGTTAAAPQAAKKPAAGKEAKKEAKK